MRELDFKHLFKIIKHQNYIPLKERLGLLNSVKHTSHEQTNLELSNPE